MRPIRGRISLAMNFVITGWCGIDGDFKSVVGDVQARFYPYGQADEADVCDGCLIIIFTPFF